MKRFILIFLFGICTGVYSQERQQEAVFPSHLLVDDYQINLANPTVAVPEHLRSSFAVVGQFPNQAIMLWDNEKENLPEEIKVSIFHFMDWSPIGEPIVVKTASQQWVLPFTPEIANSYILQIDQLDGTPITLFKFDWGVE